jgi:endonuclease YncB( thermonuclease family)
MKTYLFLLLFGISVAQAEVIHCQVTAVSTGDSFACITPQKQTYKISLYQIAAPKRDELYGEAATKALTNLIAGRNIIVHTVPSDQKDHFSGLVQYKQYISCPPPRFPGGPKAFDCYKVVDVNLDMLRQGWARYTGTFEQNPEYSRTQDEAREKWYGIWGRPNF